MKWASTLAARIVQSPVKSLTCFLLAGSAFVLSSAIVVATPRTGALASVSGAKKHCHMVTKKVHGKKMRVRVCKPRKSTGPPPTATATPPGTAANANVANILQQLDYPAGNPADYTIAAKTFQGRSVESLVNTKQQRVDAMQVELNGRQEWVRGIHYSVDMQQYYKSTSGVDIPPLTQLGGVAFDAVFTRKDSSGHFGREGFKDVQQGPAIVMDAVFRIIAQQQGIGISEVPQFVLDHKYKVPITLPQREEITAGILSQKNPSDIQAAPNPAEVDLTQPIVIAIRAFDHRDGYGIRDVPESSLFRTGITSYLFSGLAVNSVGQFLVLAISTDPKDDSMIDPTDTFDNATMLFEALEIGAETHPGYHDDPSSNTNLIAEMRKRIGLHYKPGNTVIPEDPFFVSTTALPNFLGEVAI